MRSGFLAAALALTATSAIAEPAMWRLRDADSTVTLLGSVHALSPGTRWRGPAIEVEIARADRVVFETPQTVTAEAYAATQARMAALGRADDGRPLSSRLSAAGRERLRRHAPSLALSLAEVEGWKPWYAAFRLELAADARDGARGELGVERQVVAALRPNQRVEALEGAPDLVATLSNHPEAEQLRLLEGVLEGLDKPEGRRRETSAIERGWAAGEIGPLLEQTLTLKANAPAVYARLVSDRNRRWLERIAALLEGPEDVLVVVGAGHLVGPDGLPTLLRERGLKVEGP